MPRPTRCSPSATSTRRDGSQHDLSRGMAATSATPAALVERYRAALPDPAPTPPRQPARHILRPHRCLRRPRRTCGPARQPDQKAAQRASEPLTQDGALRDRARRAQTTTAPTRRYESAAIVRCMPRAADNAIMGFPCLSLCRSSSTVIGCTWSAQYRSQRLVQRGYGNYLGLAGLQAYVATAGGLNGRRADDHGRAGPRLTSRSADSRSWSARWSYGLNRPVATCPRAARTSRSVHSPACCHALGARIRSHASAQASSVSAEPSRESSSSSVSTVSTRRSKDSNNSKSAD